MRVFIAEKPSVGMEIAKALGGNIVRCDGYVQVGDDAVSWGVGHLIGQATPEHYDEQYAKWDISGLPFVPKQWKMIPYPKTKAQLKVVGALLRRATIVVNCGDAAREGQMIVDELLDYFEYKGPTKRLWLREMNLPAIRSGIANLKDNKQFKNLYASSLARSRADWIMGMNLTRGYTYAWRSKGNDGTLHIGRVQTPTLCLIVARELEIENFVPQDYFVLKALIGHKNGNFWATWQPPKDAQFLDTQGRISDRKIAQQVSAAVIGKDGLISACNTTPVAKGPPLPFSLGDLQKAANKMLGLSPAETLKIAQSLYEKHKLTTYPRTDYSHLPESEHGMSEKIIEAAKSNFGQAWDFPGEPDFSLKSSAWNTAKIGDHHGIRPTTVKNYDLGQLSRHELAIYRLVVRNFLAQFYPAHRYNSTSVDVFCENETFKATGTAQVDPGWKVLFKTNASTESKKDEEVENDQALPVMVAGEDCKISKTDVEAKKTSPPPRYDGASLIDAMEKAYQFVTDPKVKAHIKETGIGTPATRAAIVDNIVDREYVEEVKDGQRRKVYAPTAKGRMLYQAVPDQLRKPDLTAYFEELLKAIERGELQLPEFMDHQVKYVSKLVEDIKSGKIAAAMPSLQECAPPQRKNASRSTSASRNKAATLKNHPAQASKAPSGGEKACPKCGAAMRQRNGAKGPFYGCSGYPDCKHTEQLGQGKRQTSDDLPI